MIVLDPGHGGRDHGASYYGLQEKRLNLQLANRLKHYLAQYGFRVILTRRGDEQRSLQQRVNCTRWHQAQLFISLHADACPRREVRGVTIFVLSPMNNLRVAARWFARSEHTLVQAQELQPRDQAVGGWLTELASRSLSQASAAAGQAILRAITISHSSYLHLARLEYANFWVLKAPHVPSLLIEAGFLSNPTEAKLLKQPKYRDQLARAIAQGINQYFKS